MDPEVETIKRRILQFQKLSNNEAEEMRRMVEQLVDRVTMAAAGPRATKPRKLGDPAVVGHAGFGITTLMMQLHNLGCMKSGPVLWLGLIYGGLAQFIAGLLEFGTGNNFGFCAFTTFGAFWLSLVATLLAGDYSRYEAGHPELAVFMVVFPLHTSIMFIASTRHNTALPVLFFTLTTGLIFSAFYHFFPQNKWLEILSSCVLLICALTALYVMAHLVFLESFQFDLLPVGPPLHQWFGKKRPALVDGLHHGSPYVYDTSAGGFGGISDHYGLATVDYRGIR